MKSNEMWSDLLKCRWTAWRVVANGHLALDMPPDNCCDMCGAIKVAQSLCPTVRRIDTFVDGEPDTSYTTKAGTSEWEAT
jgi:hypothetical protein